MVCPKCKDKMMWLSNFDVEEDDGTFKGIHGTYSCENKKCDVQDVYIITYEDHDED